MPSTTQCLVIVFSTIGVGNSTTFAVGDTSDKAVINTQGNAGNTSINSSFNGTVPGPVQSSPIGTDLSVVVIYNDGTSGFQRVNGVDEGNYIQASPGVNLTNISIGSKTDETSFAEMYMQRIYHAFHISTLNEFFTSHHFIMIVHFILNLLPLWYINFS